MIQLNSDVVFVDTSGQLRAHSGDLTLRADDTGSRDIILGSGQSVRPEQHNKMDLGRIDLRWRNLHAGSGTFTSRPSINGSGVLLQGEDAPLGYACYVVNESINFVTFTGTFTPIRWNELIFQDDTYFTRAVNNERITFLRTGLYKVTFAVIAQKESSGAGTSEWEVEVNNVGTTIRAGRAYIRHELSSSLNNIATTSKTFIRAFNAGDFIEVQGAVIAGGGAVGVSDGTSIVLELIRTL